MGEAETFADFVKAFPFEKGIEDQIRSVLVAATRAPSTHNSQPWLFHLDGNTLTVFRNEHITMPYSDSEGRYAHISIGFLLHHIFAISTSLGMHPHIEVIADGNKIAVITFNKATPPRDARDALAAAIFVRKNRRGIFDKSPLPENVITESTALDTLMKDTPCAVAPLTRQDDIIRVAELAYQNMLRVYERKEFRNEMSHWITTPQSKRKEGLPTYSLNQPYLIGSLLPTIIKHFNIGKVPGKATYGALASAPVLYGFGSREAPRGWLSVGYAASHAALTLIAHGYSYSVFVAAIEYEDTRKEAQKIFGLSEPLQFIFAAGTLPKTESWKTPRKDIESLFI